MELKACAFGAGTVENQAKSAARQVIYDRVKLPVG